MAVKDLRANSEKISDFDEQIRSLNNRKKRLMEQNKQTVYDILAELYGKQNQELVDAVSAEHQLIERLTASGMTYEDIAELADGHKVDTTASDDAYLDGQMTIEY